MVSVDAATGLRSATSLNENSTQVISYSLLRTPILKNICERLLLYEKEKRDLIH